MTRYRLGIEYNGAAYVGWQRQDNGLGVQEVIESAIHAFTGERPAVFCAGRTDAGVHARGQVGHFDLIRDDMTAKTVHAAINYHTKPHAISITDVEVVDSDFHARFSASEREYLYVILNRQGRPALDEGSVWWVPVPLDAERMHDAAQVLIGKHDFTTFRATHCQADSPEKTMSEITIARNPLKGDEIHMKVRARSFLHHQVRNLAGTLKLVGEGKWTKDDLKAALEARDRSAGGQTAPAHALYMMRVGYED